MKEKIIIDANFPTEIRVARLDKHNNIEDIEFSSSNKTQVKGNIYLAKITRVEPSLQAAFVDYGGGKSGFLPFSEIHSDYYHSFSTEKKSSNLVGEELKSPEITSEDLAEKPGGTKFNELADSDAIDIKAIEKMVDEKLQSDINIEASEDDVDAFSNDSAEQNKQYKIQEVIRKGQVLLVQVTKEERGNKGASMTTYISLAGKYCVLMPNKPSHNGISRKVSNRDERRRIKNVISSITELEDSKTSSVIARTAAAGHTTLDIKRDYDYLVKLWNKIREITLKSQAPCFVHQEDGIILKTIRDMFNRNVKEILVQGSEAYNSCIKFMGDIMPTHVRSVKEYKNKTPIFTKFGIEDQLIKLYQPVVHLPSGGYIVINPTEALVSIDVNSGRATSERNIEEMALKTNLEAAKEIAKQARIRDLSGLLVLDFIDLNEARNRKILERSLWEYFGKDKARIQTSHLSAFGLLEMSRQRLRPSFLERNSDMCSHCSGKGLVRSDDSNAMLILRTVENEIHNGKFDIVNVYGAASAVIFLLNSRREEISFIEKKYSIKLDLFIDRDATSDSYSIEKIKLSDKNKADTPEELQPILQDTSEIYNQNSSQQKTKRKIEKAKRPQEKKKPKAPEETASSNSTSSNNNSNTSNTNNSNKEAENQTQDKTQNQTQDKNETPQAKEEQTAKPARSKKRIPRKPRRGREQNKPAPTVKAEADKTPQGQDETT
ncbi:MAG: ribonuclease E [Rickettsiales bacterium]|nr:MAG: ribonuclease E [Rickettsiales bacterium]